MAAGKNELDHGSYESMVIRWSKTTRTSDICLIAWRRYLECGSARVGFGESDIPVKSQTPDSAPVGGDIGARDT